MARGPGHPHILFINKIDTFTGRVAIRLRRCRPIHIGPWFCARSPRADADDAVTGYVDVVSERAYRYREGQPSELIEFPAELRPREEEALAGLGRGARRPR